MNNISILIIIVLSVLTGFNAYYLCYFWRRAKKEGKIEEKDNYYKLDAKIELQKYLAIGLIAIAAFFGFSQFSDINKDIKKVENIDSTISKLESDYQTLDSNYKALFNDNDIFFKESNSKINELNNKLEKATERIPEDNLRVLAESLIRSRIDYMANIGRVSARGYSKEEIQSEIIKSMESLRDFGFNEIELNQIQNNLEREIELLNF